MILIGDVAHTPLQLVRPELPVTGDADLSLARRSRETVVSELEDSAVYAAAAHFPYMRFGRLVGSRGQRQWLSESEAD